jgi:hypothetical protein
VILIGGVTLPAEVLEVNPGRSWSWRVGGIVVEHEINVLGGGVELRMPVSATGTIWKPVAFVYSGIVVLIGHRIVTIAERDTDRR